MAPRVRTPWHAKLDLPSILAHAGRLRDMPCTCDISKQPMSGSLNWAIILAFEDGVEWIFRSPSASSGLSWDTSMKVLESEVATMKYVKANSSIPVPDVYDYSSSNDNSVGLPFILMSKAPGLQLETYGWQSSRRGLCLTEPQKEKIMHQLGVISSQLANLTFSTLGSIIEEAGEYRIGRCLSPGMVFHGRDELAQGPFSDDVEYHKGLLSALEFHVQNLQIQHSVFFAPIPTADEFESGCAKAAISRWNELVAVGEKINSPRNRLDYRILQHLLLKIVPSICTGAPYALSHQDLSTSNIFVDEDLNITCIIDWAFSSTVPMAALLATPSLPHPRDDADPKLHTAFRAPFADRPEFGPEFWERSRRAWSFTRLASLDGLKDYHHFKELYTSVFSSGPLSISDLFSQAEKEIGLTILDFADNEEDTKSIAKAEHDYFFSHVTDASERLDAIERQAIARKITMVREISRDYVADVRLWRWIEMLDVGDQR